MNDTVGSALVLVAVLIGMASLLLLVKIRTGASLHEILFRWDPFEGRNKERSLDKLGPLGVVSDLSQVNKQVGPKPGKLGMLYGNSGVASTKYITSADEHAKIQREKLRLVRIVVGSERRRISNRDRATQYN